MKRVLVIGDGDLSYSAALAEKQAGQCVVSGSVLPSKEGQTRLYGAGTVADKEDRLRKASGHVLYSVDATQLQPTLAVVLGTAAVEPFDEIHFNFPHLGYSQQAERGGSWSRAGLHVDFFKKMFSSLSGVQSTGGTFKLTLTPNPPYSIKDVKVTATNAGYSFVREVAFESAEYPGYHPAWGDDRDIIKGGTSAYGSKGGRQLVFENCCCAACGLLCKGKEQIAQHLLSKKHAIALRKARAKEKQAKNPGGGEVPSRSEQSAPPANSASGRSGRAAKRQKNTAEQASPGRSGEGDQQQAARARKTAKKTPDKAAPKKQQTQPKREASPKMPEKARSASAPPKEQETQPKRKASPKTPEKAAQKRNAPPKAQAALAKPDAGPRSPPKAPATAPKKEPDAAQKKGQEAAGRKRKADKASPDVSASLPEGTPGSPKAKRRRKAAQPAP
ncbi:25S rRNA (uridine-N(3))-methyltransferase [Diplonema papillatum]|nr:25S rRNA (uridine-N(3))-methyltransferase [Diplonema papillatum]